MERDAAQIRAVEKELDELKGNVLDAVYIQSTKQLVFSSTHSYLIFVDVSKSLAPDHDHLQVVGHLKTTFPIHGLHYSPVLDVLVCYPGEGSDHEIEIYDPKSRRQKFLLRKHEHKILTICEVVLDKAHPQKDHFFVTSSINKKVVMWPSAPISALMKNENAKKMLRVADTMDFELRGHHHAITSLVFAPVREMIFGCGFDFDVIGWDPFSRDVTMRFVGHFKSMSGLQVVNVPNEKLLSLDEGGVLKLWNISKELGIYGEQESSTTLQCQQPVEIKDFVKTFDGGKGVAILAEKVYFLAVESDSMDDMKPLKSGLGICSFSGRLYGVYRTTIQIYDIVSAMRIKRVAFLDPDRVSSSDVIMSKSDEIKVDHHNMSAANALHSKPKSAYGYIDIRDKVSAVATDSKGKKLFLGTDDGRVLLFDSFTFGLIKQLTNEREDGAFMEQGAVSFLYYVDRDELLVAAYTNGAVKVFSGCQHGGYSGQQVHTFNSKPLEESSSKGDISYPKSKGGKAPSDQQLLRECDLGVITDLSVRELAVSVTHSLIATLTKTGMVYLYDYLTMEFLQCISFEDDEVPRGVTVQYVDIDFLPYLPILIVANSLQRVSAWSVKSMGYRHLLSWNIHTDVTFNSCAHEFYAGYDDLVTIDYNGRVNFSGIDKKAPESLDDADDVASPTINNDPDSKIKQGDNVDFDAIKTSSFDLNYKSTISFMRSYAFPSPMNDQAYESLKPGIIDDSYRWILLFGNDSGQVFTMDLSNLVKLSSALDFLPKLDVKLAVFQKLTPRRFLGLESTDHRESSFRRLHLPEDLHNKLTHPLKKESKVELTRSPSQTGLAELSSTVSVTETTIPLLNRSHSQRNLKQTSSKFKRSQTRKNIRHKALMDQLPHVYVKGLYAWTAYNQNSVKAIQFYNPRINIERDTFMPYDQHYESFPHRNKLPLLVTMSDDGLMRVWSLGGVYLGQTFDEVAQKEMEDKGNSSTFDFIAKVEGVESTQKSEQLVASQIIPVNNTRIIYDEDELMASSTFVTSLIPDESRSKVKSSLKGDALSSSKVYLTSDRNSTVTSRRLSVVSKALMTEQSSTCKTLSKKQPSLLPQSGRCTSVASKGSIQVEMGFITPTRKSYGSAGWLLPLTSVSVNALNRCTDVFSVQALTRFSVAQYSYLKFISTWVTPHISAEVDSFFRTKFSLEVDTSIPAPLLSKALSYRERFQSEIGLLQKMNSFIADRLEANNPKMTHHDEQVDPDHMFAKIGGAMTQQELKLVDALKLDCQRKFEKRNLNYLIDHIQKDTSESFPNVIKDGQSHLLTFKNFELEKQRHCHRARGVSQEVEELISSIKLDEARSLKYKSKTLSRPKSAPGIGVKFSKTLLQPAESALNMLDSNEVLINDDLPLQVEFEPLLNVEVATTVVNTNDVKITSTTLNESPLLALQPNVAQRPRTAGPRMKTTISTDQLSPSKPFPSRPSSAMSLNNVEFRRSSPDLLRSRSMKRIDQIIDDVDCIAVSTPAVSERHFLILDATASPLRSMNDLIRPSTAPAIIQSDDVTDFLVNTLTQQPLSLLGRTNVVEDTFSNYGRLTEISLHVDEAIATSAQTDRKHFRQYDPLHKKKMLALMRNRRKLKQMLSFAKDKDKYIDEEEYHQHFEDIVDVEREHRKATGKHLLRQAQAINQQVSSYGPYKTSDLIKFIHFLGLLTPIDLAPQERRQLTYFDESGTIDYTKVLCDQDYYSVNEILEVVLGLMGNEHNLYKNLLYFRDEVPHQERINMYQLIGEVFLLAKPIGVQLRIYLFVTASHLLYDLFKHAIPPKDFKSKLGAKPKDSREIKLIPAGGAGDTDSKYSKASSKTLGTLFSPVIDTPDSPSRFRNALRNAVNTDKGFNDNDVVIADSSSKSLPKESADDNIRSESNSSFPGEPQSNDSATLKVQEGADFDDFENDLLETVPEEVVETENARTLKESLHRISVRSVVRPHPVRGFYKWIIKRQVSSIY
jgi:hypothetical protein